VTNEYIVQMLPMVAIAGVLVAWLAQVPKTNRGYGFMPDMALAVVGSVAAGALIALGVTGDAGMIVMFWGGVVGATVLLGAQRRLWPATVGSG
jgi:uncharacterized membrane protein YeaQ/YmgE (transglycosylase-associated protein family)